MKGAVVALGRTRRGGRYVMLGLLLAMVLTLAGAVPARAGPSPAAAGTSDAAGLEVLETRRLSDRLLDVTVGTAALPEPVHVRVLLPTSYRERPARSYPVLYLLHGGLDHYRAWTESGNAAAITAGLPLIVVMPEGGSGGWYTNWYNGGEGGPPRWETFHIGQLVPWVDANFRTVAARRGRAVAGLSMGGFGAMSYAARHPDTFVAAASFSGAVDTNQPVVGVVISAASMSDGGNPDAIFGPRATQEVRWRGHNPWDLAGNLRGLRLAVYTGNGWRGPYDETGLPYDPVEGGVHNMSTSFHERLRDLDIPHTWADYGPGQHSWPYWRRDLRQWLPALMDTFADPPAPPDRLTYTSTDPRYGVYGWRVSVHRDVREFSTLRAGADTFSLTGSGTATVTTPPRYRPGGSYAVRIVRDDDSCVVTRLTADASGHLEVPLVMGPANQYQQYTAAARIHGTQTYTTTVTVGGGPTSCT